MSRGSGFVAAATARSESWGPAKCRAPRASTAARRCACPHSQEGRARPPALFFRTPRAPPGRPAESCPPRTSSQEPLLTQGLTNDFESGRGEAPHPRPRSDAQVDQGPRGWRVRAASEGVTGAGAQRLPRAAPFALEGLGRLNRPFEPEADRPGGGGRGRARTQKVSGEGVRARCY